jgi:hypothetical protein
LVVSGLILGLYNYYRFGDPFDTGYFEAWSHTLGQNSGFFSGSIVTGVYGLWLSTGKGLLLYSPSLILAISGLPVLFAQERRLVAGIVLTAASYTALYGVNFAWHGSHWCWGPRYLIPIVPLLMCAFPRSSSMWTLHGRMATAVVALSALIQVAAVTVDYRRNLTETYVVEPRAFSEDRILFAPSLCPVVGQVRACWAVLSQVPKWRELHDYLPQSGWKDERRPASPAMMLDDSLDYNSVNFWWFRQACTSGGWVQIGFLALGGALGSWTLCATIYLWFALGWRPGRPPAS